MMAGASRILTSTIGAATLLWLSISNCSADEPNAKAFTAISPIFSELVAFSLPSNFTTVFENANRRNYIREAVLKGETTDRWSQMITVTGAKDLASDPKVSPQSFAASIAGGFKKACPETFSVAVFGPTQYSDHEGFAAVASCGKVNDAADKRSEAALIVAVKGRADYYTVQWAERTPSSAENLTIDTAKWKARLSTLQPIKFCTVVAEEKAPYPSCLGAP